MKKSTIASLVSLAFASSTFAAENINLDDVVVTASRIQQPRENVLTDITVIDQEQIQRAVANSLTSLLQAQAGVQINSNGGAGQTSGVFLRGTNTGHVIVLIDGLRINSAISGTTALENISLAQIEKIEILRGPASSLYGADAIGGVIQIFTKKGETDKPVVHAVVGLGSYNTQTAEAGFSGTTGDTHYGINLNSYVTDGLPPVQSNTPLVGNHGNYRNLGISAFIDHTFVVGQSLGLQYFGSKGHSNFYNSWDTYFQDYNTETQQSYAITSRNQINDIWHSTLKLGRGIDDMGSYSQPSMWSTGVYLTKTVQNQYTWQNDLSLPVGALTLAYDRLEQQVSGIDTADYAVKSRDNNGYLAGYVADIGKHMIQASLREDRNSQYGNHTTGGVGYGYHFAPEWRVSANYGTAFKAPSFMDLYYPQYSNPNLNPEQSKNAEISLKYAANKQHTSVTIFDNKINNLIALSGPPTSSCISSSGCPINVDRAEIQGITVDSGWNVTDLLTLNGNFTVQSPRDEATNKLLVRRSNRYGAVSLLQTWGDWQWGAEVTGASSRYNNTANTVAMAGYALLNLTTNYRITPEWKLEARANNVLDKNYAISYSGATPYSTAGANVFVGLRYAVKP